MVFFTTVTKNVFVTYNIVIFLKWLLFLNVVIGTLDTLTIHNNHILLKV